MLKLSGAVVATLLVIVGVFVLGHSLTSSASPVFENVTAADLAGAGFTIIDPNPIDDPAVSRDQATRSMLFQAGVSVESSQLIRVNVFGGGTLSTSTTGEFLAWAIRLDTSGSGVAECFGTSLCFASSANPTIAFVNADNGDFLRAIGVPSVAP